MDEKTAGQRIRERFTDTAVSGGVAGAAVILGSNYFDPTMSPEVTIAWTVILNAVGSAVIKKFRLWGE